MQNFDVTVPIVSLADNTLEIDEKEIRTRMGYLAADCLKALDTALADPSTTSMGKALHFTADVVCSGGYYLWQKFCYEYAIDHIGLSSLKIFQYLIARFKDIDKQYEALPADTFYGSEAIQRRLSEVIITLQCSPRRGKVKIPTVGSETHRNATWLNGVRRAPESAAVRRVYIRSSDLIELYIAANEMIYACKEGALERALFWVKWVADEDAAIKKESGGGLTNSDHGVALSSKGKGRASPIHFLFLCAFEFYKEAATANPPTIKMNEEVAALVYLYKTAPTSILTGRKRTELLIILLQVLCEVPKWKNPVAGPVFKDPVLISRTVAQAPMFFKEILARPAPRKVIKKQGKPKKAKKTGENMSTEEKLAAFDAAVNKMYGLEPTGGAGGTR